uniref:Retrotransposon gag domain-containing protein n=1 Tax=Bursaphelenchus xylophilus TaxID=6326 RepID=A0A1I7SFD1_BURXY
MESTISSIQLKLANFELTETMVTENDSINLLTTITKFNSVISQQSLDSFLQRFNDYISLAGNSNDSQKIARLKFLLTDRARELLNDMNPDATYDDVISQLRDAFQNTHSKTSARQALSLCRQLPDETVFTFTQRSSKLGRAAYPTMSDADYKEILLQLFVDKLKPDLRYQVQLSRPKSFIDAYENALNLELVLQQQINSNSTTTSITSAVEALSEPRRMRMLLLMTDTTIEDNATNATETLMTTPDHARPVIAHDPRVHMSDLDRHP